MTAQVQAMPSGLYQGNGELGPEIETALTRYLSDLDPNTPKETLEGQITQQVRKIAKRYTTRKPVVLSLVDIDRSKD